MQRALFTAQDPKSLRQAFDKLRPNREFRHLYEAAVARQQADQIFNLSLTRTATRTLLPAGVKGVIGIGRVKTPTLAIVCLREIEIRDFRPEDYFEIVATAKVAAGTFTLATRRRQGPRIRDRARAEAIASRRRGLRGPLAVDVEHRRQAPPRLFDLPSLQKTCGQRWGWTADKTLAIAQELYDGEGKKLITYPRAEARHLAENQIADVPAIVAAMIRLRGFAHLQIDRPVIRRGKSGHFCDKALEGVSHHAIVPNVNVMDDLEARIARLSDDEKRLFALICRSYLAAVMPDFEYRQTVVRVPVPWSGGGARVPRCRPHPSGAGLEGGLRRGRARSEGARRRGRRGGADAAPARRRPARDADRGTGPGEADPAAAALQRGHAGRRHAERLALRQGRGPARAAEGGQGHRHAGDARRDHQGPQTPEPAGADGKLVVPTRGRATAVRTAARRRPRAGRSRHHGGLGDAARRHPAARGRGAAGGGRDRGRRRRG